MSDWFVLLVLFLQFAVTGCMPGRSSWYCDKNANKRNRLRHIQDFQRASPEMLTHILSCRKKKGNRGDRLKDQPAVGRDPIARCDRVRDEKTTNCLNNVNWKIDTTVTPASRLESGIVETHHFPKFKKWPNTKRAGEGIQQSKQKGLQGRKSTRPWRKGQTSTRMATVGSKAEAEQRSPCPPPQSWQ